MTDYSELVKRLRVCERFDSDQKDAADALEAQAKEIEKLNSIIEGAFQSNLQHCRLQDAQSARIAELEATITAATVILSEFGVPSEDKNEDAFNVLTDAISSAALNGEG